MKVAFFLQGENQDYRRMAKMTIASVRKAMPGVEVWHLTDADTPMVHGADGIRRVSEPMPMAVRRMTHNSMLRGEWLFIDCDIIVKRDVSHVFDDPFDVALTDRAGTDMEGTPYAATMPYNLGVAFSRSNKFWEKVLLLLSKESIKLQQWCGDQIVISKMMKMENYCGFDVKVLPGKTYNFPPLEMESQDTDAAAILHFKGQRKLILLGETAA